MTTVFQDLFTEASADTQLDSHSPDTGTSWTELDRTSNERIKALYATDQAGVTVSNAGQHALYQANPAPSGADMDVLIVLDDLESSADDPIILLARIQDSSNYYLALIYPSNANPDIVIGKVVAGSWTQLNSANIGPGATEEWKFELRGTTLKLYQDDVEKLSTTDSDISSAGEGGFGMGNIRSAGDDVGDGWRVDNFRVEEPAAPGGSAQTGQAYIVL